MKGPARALLLALVALGLVILAGGGSVWAHYRSTPTFREWARATPVDDALWRAHVPAGVELGRGPAWRSDDGPPRERFGQWRARFTVEHGDELLLDLEVEVRVESREVDGWAARDVASEAFEGLDVFVTDRAHDPDFHGVAVLTVYGLADYVDGATTPTMTQGPRMQLDVFALAGPGSVELVVQDLAKQARGRETALLAGGDFYAHSTWIAGEVLAQFLSLEDPPADGLAYQARAWMFPNWSRVEGGSQGAARGRHGFGATTRLYSARLRAIRAYRAPYDPADHFSTSTTDEVARSYQWNGEVW